MTSSRTVENNSVRALMRVILFLSILLFYMGFQATFMPWSPRVADGCLIALLSTQNTQQPSFMVED